MDRKTLALSSSFHVRYDGDAIQPGRIDTRALADSLIAITDTLERSNKVLNGKNSEIVVKIDANMTPGSFIVKLFTEFTLPLSETLEEIGGSPGITGLASIAGILGFCQAAYKGTKNLLGFMKEARNRKILSRNITEDDHISVTVEGDEQIDGVTQEILDLYEDRSVRIAIENMSQVLSSDGVTSMSFWDEEGGDCPQNSEMIRYSDIPSLRAPESGVLLDRDEETILIITLANLAGEPSGWKFKEDETSSDFPADVFDNRFLDDIKKRKISLKCGDMAKVLLKKQQSRPRKNLKTTYSVLRVLEFIPYEDE